MRLSCWVAVFFNLEVTINQPKTKKYIADVNRLGTKTVVVEANSEKEALAKLVAQWGEQNIIIPPHRQTSQAQLDSFDPI